VELLEVRLLVQFRGMLVVVPPSVLLQALSEEASVKLKPGSQFTDVSMTTACDVTVGFNCDCSSLTYSQELISMRNIFWLLLLGAITAGSLNSAQVWAQSTPEPENNDQINLDELSCRTLLKADGEERSNIIIFMHGYMSGQNEEKLINAPALAGITEKVIDGCIDNPDQLVLATFEEYR
jgi:hypothetical protein